MGVNFIEVNTAEGMRTVMDLRELTVTPETLLKGIKAKNALGEDIVGVHECSGGGGSVAVAEATPTSNALSLSFSGLSGEPVAFAVVARENVTMASTRYVLAVVCENGDISGVCGYKSGSMMSSTATAYAVDGFSWEYENGVLTVTSDSASTSGYFMNGITYNLVYVTASEGEADTGETAAVIEPLEITENGTYIAGSGVDGYSPITVSVQHDVKLQSKTATPSDTAQAITPDSGYDGLSVVEVGAIPGDYIIPSGTLEISENGTHDVKNYAAVSVNIENNGGATGGNTTAVYTAESTPSSNSLTISFNVDTDEPPSAFSIAPTENVTLATTRYALTVDYKDGETSGICGYRATSSATAYYLTSYTWEFADGVLTITSAGTGTGGYFRSGITYKLLYVTTQSNGEGATGGEPAEPEVIEISYTLPAGLMYGDVNMDGYITEEDYELLHDHALQSGGVITDATALILADVNGDGSVSAKDYKQLKRIYLQEEQATDYMGDYLGNWSVSEDWGTDFSKRFYVDINVGEATENKLAVITADVDIAENDFKALCGNGTIRIYAKNLPLNSLAVTINMKEKSTNIFLQEKVIAPSEVEQIITPDDGYEGFRQVKISAIPAGDDSGGDSGASGDGLPDTIVAGDTPILADWTGGSASTTEFTDTGLTVTVPKDGTYRFYMFAYKSSTSTMGGSPTITIYKNGIASGSEITVSNTNVYSVDVECSAGDVVSVWGKGVKASYGNTVYGVTVSALIACIDK